MYIEKTPLIIDTDPGVDDAVALIQAFYAPNLDIKLICSTAGNLGIETTTRNAIHLCELYEQNIPVAQGLPGPLYRDLETATNPHGSVHGKMGFGKYVYEGVKNSPIELPAYEAMHYALQLYKGTTILVLGPLTNVAKLLLEYPEDAKRIKTIVFMGGTKENVLMEDNPYPEFNISRDPEAVDIVLKSGADIVIIPMEFGHNAYIPQAEIKKLKSINKTGEIFHTMYQDYKDGHVKDEDAATHDSCAIAYVIEPTLFKLEPVTCEFIYRNDKGILVSNLAKESNIKLAIDMDYAGFKNLYYGLLSISKTKDE